MFVYLLVFAYLWVCLPVCLSDGAAPPVYQAFTKVPIYPVVQTVVKTAQKIEEHFSFRLEMIYKINSKLN